MQRKRCEGVIEGCIKREGTRALILLLKGSSLTGRERPCARREREREREREVHDQEKEARGRVVFSINYSAGALGPRRVMGAAGKAIQVSDKCAVRRGADPCARNFRGDTRSANVSSETCHQGTPNGFP